MDETRIKLKSRSTIMAIALFFMFIMTNEAFALSIGENTRSSTPIYSDTENIVPKQTLPSNTIVLRTNGDTFFMPYLTPQDFSLRQGFQNLRILSVRRESEHTAVLTLRGEVTDRGETGNLLTEGEIVVDGEAFRDGTNRTLLMDLDMTVEKSQSSLETAGKPLVINSLYASQRPEITPYMQTEEVQDKRDQRFIEGEAVKCKNRVASKVDGVLEALPKVVLGKTLAQVSTTDGIEGKAIDEVELTLPIKTLSQQISEAEMYLVAQDAVKSETTENGAMNRLTEDMRFMDEGLLLEGEKCIVSIQELGVSEVIRQRFDKSYGEDYTKEIDGAMALAAGSSGDVLKLGNTLHPIGETAGLLTVYDDVLSSANDENKGTFEQRQTFYDGMHAVYTESWQRAVFGLTYEVLKADAVIEALDEAILELTRGKLKLAKAIRKKGDNWEENTLYMEMDTLQKYYEEQRGMWDTQELKDRLRELKAQKTAVDSTYQAAVAELTKEKERAENGSVLDYRHGEWLTK